MLKNLFLALSLMVATTGAVYAASETELTQVAKQNNMEGPVDTDKDMTQKIIQRFAELGKPVPDPSKVDHFAVFKFQEYTMLVIIDADHNEGGTMVLTAGTYATLLGEQL